MSRLAPATLIPLALLCAACGSTSSTEPLTPPDARAIILKNRPALWKDPDSIRDASIAPPTRHMNWMWHVCVQLNARNSFGGYVGLRHNVVAIYDDARPPEVLVENAVLNCASAPYEPFPELNGGQPAPSPQPQQKQPSKK